MNEAKASFPSITISEILLARALTLVASPATHTAFLPLVGSSIARSCASISRSGSGVVPPEKMSPNCSRLTWSLTRCSRAVSSMRRARSKMLAALSTTLPAASRAPCGVRAIASPVAPRTPPAAPGAAPPKKPAKADSASRNLASSAVNNGSRSARLATAMPSCASSVVASIAPPCKAPVPTRLAKLAKIPPSTAARFVACSPISLSKAYSLPTPIAAWGTATTAARNAVSLSRGWPDSKASDRLLPDRGANSAAKPPPIAPRVAACRSEP